MLFLGLASVGIVAHIVKVLDVICTVNEPNSFVPPRVAHNAPVPAASLARVRSNASIFSVLPQVTEVHELRRNPAQLAGWSLVTSGST